jgi:hypothetical protein
MIRRREFLISAGAGVGALALGPAWWQRAMAAAAEAQPGPGPYGPLLDPDANGVRLPAGFSSRVIARAGTPVGRRAFPLPIFPDGATTFATPDGGWIYVVNSEVPGAGGASAIRFSAAGGITDAYSILGGTSTNCAGGRTPWGTWLSGEEVEQGFIWECDPTGATGGVRRDALGCFKHEAACVDPIEGRVYLTEDLGDGGLYRFTPGAYPDLSTGLLEIATVAADNSVSWTAVPNPTPTADDTPTRQQVAGSTQFARGEGIWYDAGVVYVATTSDDTIHAYDVASRTISILYRRADTTDSPLQGVDNITVSRSGDLFVCEDSYDNDPDAMDVCIISREGEVARFAKLTGAENFLPDAAESEITGVCFDPSGQRMYFGSQRAAGVGAIYEISGPFRLKRPGDAPQTNASNPLGPAIGVELARKAPLALLTGTGLPIALTLDGPATVTTVLTAAHTGRQRKPKVIARNVAELGRGRNQIQLIVRGRKRRRALRHRRRPLVGELQLTIANGASRTAVGRRVKLTL